MTREPGCGRVLVCAVLGRQNYTTHLCQLSIGAFPSTPRLVHVLGKDPAWRRVLPGARNSANIGASHKQGSA